MLGAIATGQRCSVPVMNDQPDVAEAAMEMSHHDSQSESGKMVQATKLN